MRIAFIVIGNSRRSNYLNGYTLRYGGAGGSGTDSSVIIVAEYLSKKGFECVIALDDLEPQLKESYENKYLLGEEINGVKYTDKNFIGISNKKFDILVSMLWYSDYDKLPITVSKSVIYWSHMQWIYGIDEMLKFTTSNNLNLRFVHISEWERSMTKSTVNSAKLKLKDCDSTVISNPIMDDVAREVLDLNIQKKKNKFIFHASWARGGDVSLEAVRQMNLKDCEFHAFDYLMATHDHKDSFFYKHNGVDKFTLFKHLAESEYFIYPLYTPYQDVHKDTFSCVVAEALAFNVKVITYPFGALPENFDYFCHWLELPPNSKSLEDIQKEPLTKDEDDVYKYTDNIVKKVKQLESETKYINDISNSSSKYILDKFSIDKIGKLWVDLINSL